MAKDNPKTLLLVVLLIAMVFVDFTSKLLSVAVDGALAVALATVLWPDLATRFKKS